MTLARSSELLHARERITVMLGGKIKHYGWSIRRIAYWYAGDIRVQFGYRRLRIAEYHLLH
jgi:hypothetical protein